MQRGYLIQHDICNVPSRKLGGIRPKREAKRHRFSVHIYSQENFRQCQIEEALKSFNKVTLRY